MIIDRLKSKKIVILGFGREGKSSLNYIRKYLPTEIIAIADDNIDKIDIDDNYIVKCSKDYIKELDDYDIILKSPGIPVKNHKYDNVLSKISSQTDLFIDEYRDKIIGVTGTKGKSTTSSLIYHILKNNNKDVILAGNIGLPVFDIIDDIKDDTTIVFELSSHQLEFVHSSPHIGILLNIYEEHLDHYDSFEAYQNCKKNIFKFMKNDDYLIYNPDNEYLNLNSNADYKLLGDHNYLNISFAYMVSKIFRISDSGFTTSLEEFQPLPHRMEYIGESRGNKYYNDSISTIPEATIKAIESIDNIQTVIIGGMDRGINYKKLIDYIPTCSVKNIIFLPDSGKRIKDSLEKQDVDKSLFMVSNLEEAVKLADKITENGGVLLSPAAASYGVYKNFEERGNHFKECFPHTVNFWKDLLVCSASAALYQRREAEAAAVHCRTC